MTAGASSRQSRTNAESGSYQRSRFVRAQSASDSDVVTCGVCVTGKDGRSEYFFAGEPAGLGVLANGYGTVALLRRSLLDGDTSAGEPHGDPDWPLLARLGARGARIASIPLPLVTRSTAPGTIERDPEDGLLVVENLEQELPEHLGSLARLAAGLAAEASRRTSGFG